MNTETLNRWIAIGANVGVLVGIILLIFELSQTRDMMRAQMRQQISQSATEYALATAGDRQLAELTIRAASGEWLEGVDALQYRFRLSAYFRQQENIHYQARQGLFDDAEFAGVKRQWRRFAQISPGIRRSWCELRDVMSAEFRADMDTAFGGLDCEAMPSIFGPAADPN